MLKLFPAVWGSESFMLHAIVVVGFVVVNGLCMLPLRPDNEFEVVALRHKSSNFIKDFLSIYNPNVIFMVAAIGFFMMIIPQTNYGVVKASLKFMAIGGNVERRYYFSEQDFNSVPDVLVDLTPPELLRIPNAKITKNVYVVLDVGNSLIVSLSDNDGERIVYALPKDKMRYLLEVKPLSAK